MLPLSRTLLLSILTLSTGLTQAGAIPPKSPPPPPIIPQPGPADTTGWALIEDVYRFENGRFFYYCDQKKKPQCMKDASMTPQEALTQVIGPHAVLTGLSPRLSYSGRLTGAVLYFKKEPEAVSLTPIDQKEPQHIQSVKAHSTKP